jgi:pimeloyl-ACP methyl ester carboxylesterase
VSFFIFKNKKVFYSEFGDGMPLLFLHGNTASSSMFDGFAERYTKDFKVVLIDLLGHGKSDRLDIFPADLWFFEAEQVIAFLREKQYAKVNIIGSSGGALVAINVALEEPERVNKIIADSFEGEKPIAAFINNIEIDREMSKKEEGAKSFYLKMHGYDWEKVVDNDTSAVFRHQKGIGVFFHRDLGSLKPAILMTGSKEDEFASSVKPDFFEEIYGEMVSKIGHGEIHLFEAGGHPAMLSNQEDFHQVSLDFFLDRKG